MPLNSTFRNSQLPFSASSCQFVAYILSFPHIYFQIISTQMYSSHNNQSRASYFVYNYSHMKYNTYPSILSNPIILHICHLSSLLPPFLHAFYHTQMLSSVEPLPHQSYFAKCFFLSCINLNIHICLFLPQRQVLALLAQLIQLRVNYCLLDSDQIFIGFVIKQFEFIEEGQIR